MSEGNGRMSTLKKAGGTTGDRNELKRATEKAKKEYLENTCTEFMEFHRTGHYDLMYLKTKELGWKETQGIKNTRLRLQTDLQLWRT